MLFFTPPQPFLPPWTRYLSPHPPIQGLGDRCEFRLPQSPFPSRGHGQQGGKRRMHHQDHPQQGKKPAAARQVPVVGPPENFSRPITRSTAVRPLYNRSNFFVACGTASSDSMPINFRSDSLRRSSPRQASIEG